MPLKEIFEYLWKNKIWWLLPAIAVTILLGVLIVFGGGGHVSPFIYMFF